MADKSYKYGYQKSEPDKPGAIPMFGDDLNFEGTEAFNLLRTNLSFSFADDKKCHIIGITSAVPGAGKSIISTNLAYSIAKLNQRVLLVDGDLRLPTVASKMKLLQKPGLSNVLVSEAEPADVIQKYNDNFDVIAAGAIPPQPSELLGSVRMGEMLDELSNLYDYIIIDLTPVIVVPDTLAIAKYLDGVVFVVRDNHEAKPAVADAMRQLQLSKVKLLGIVFNHTENADGDGGYYKKYKGYKGYKYSHNYGYYGAYGKKN